MRISDSTPSHEEDNSFTIKNEIDKFLDESGLNVQNTLLSVKNPHEFAQILSSSLQATDYPKISLDHAVSSVQKARITDSQKKIDDLLAMPEMQPFFPLLKHLKEKSESIIAIMESSEPNKLADVSEPTREFFTAFQQLLDSIAVWQSEQLLSSDQVLACAADYVILSDNTLSTFAEDATGQNELHLQKFVAHSLGLATLSIDVRQVEKGLTSGTQPGDVYRVYDTSTKTLLCVIKVKDPQTVADEINGLRLMHKQDMTACHFPEVVGLGKCKTADMQEVVLFAQSAAPGRSVDSYFEDLACADNPETKSACRERLDRAVSAMAKGMAEIHDQTVNPQAASKISFPSEIDTFRSSFLKKIEAIEQQNLLPATTIEALKKNHAEYTAEPENASVVHGDFHPGNAFFSDDLDQFTIVDNDNLIKALDIFYNVAIRTASDEFTYCQQWIHILGALHGLDQETTNQLAQQLESTYLEARTTSKGHLQEEITYMRMYNSIEYIALLSEVMQNPFHPWHLSLGPEKLKQIQTVLISTIT